MTQAPPYISAPGVPIEGLNNVQIAGRLTVSPSTIKLHVSNILSKLGVASRTEAWRLLCATKLSIDYSSPPSGGDKYSPADGCDLGVLVVL